MVTDTKPEQVAQKTCSKCGDAKEADKFIKARNICKDCRNSRSREKHKAIQLSTEANKTCITCNTSKPETDFIKNRNYCKDCNNKARRKKYESNDEFRAKVIQQATEFKQEKAEKRRKKKLEEIGEGNKKCSNCSSIKPANNFRHNRLTCKVCEREEPIQKFKRNVRSRIYLALKQNKELRTVKYLGCTSPEYMKWIFCYDQNYNLDNHGKVWHIDHVIPLSRFNLEDKDEQMIAFNWRNTMPLSVKENLAKNNKILPVQVEQHLKCIIEYHKNKNIEFPQKFIDLFAKHLVDGNPLKQSLPLISGNFGEDLG
jgi:uncharacterized protein (DUF983 family)